MKNLKHIGPLSVLLFAGCLGGESLVFDPMSTTGSSTSTSSSSCSSSSQSSSNSGGVGGMAGHGGFGGTTGCSASSTGFGGNGGAQLPCDFDSDCPGISNECTKPKCIVGYCGTANAKDGVIVSEQIAGDCRIRKCDGQGNMIDELYEFDPFDDKQECTVDYCMLGTTIHDLVAQGTLCTTTEGKPGVCSGMIGLYCAECIPGVQGCPGTKICIGYMCK